MPIYALNQEPVFPDPREAEADGLLAVGGDLSPRRVLTAYSLGIFPWPIPKVPLAWFSPDPRMVLDLDALVISRSLRRTLVRRTFEVSMDRAFDEVIRACAAQRRHGQRGTWITPEMVAAYERLHDLGFCHSVEVRQGGVLVGGLYGISIGAMFCGESMFHRATDASKVAFVALVRQLRAWEFDFLDCQLYTAHLASLGATEIPRDAFLERLGEAIRKPTRRGHWTLEIDPAEPRDTGA